MSIRRLISGAFLGILSLGVWGGGGAGCNTPTVPIPPPESRLLSFAEGGLAGTVVVQGKPDVRYQGARVYVFNLSRQDGVIAATQTDGAFVTSPLAATDGDTLEIYYQRTADGAESEHRCAALHLGRDVSLTACR